MKELYERLSVAENATHEEVVAAYRRAVKAAHPDTVDQNDHIAVAAAGEAIKRINEAGDVLCDARKRREYDERGFIARKLSEEEINRVARQQVLGVITSLVQASIDQPQLAPPPESLDLMAALRQWPVDMTNHINETKRKNNRIVKTFKKMIKGFHYSGNKDNFILDRLQENLRSLEEQMAGIENDEAVVARYRELVSDYNFTRQFGDFDSDMSESIRMLL